MAGGSWAKSPENTILSPPNESSGVLKTFDNWLLIWYKSLAESIDTSSKNTYSTLTKLAFTYDNCELLLKSFMLNIEWYVDPPNNAAALPVEATKTNRWASFRTAKKSESAARTWDFPVPPYHQDTSLIDLCVG